MNTSPPQPGPGEQDDAPTVAEARKAFERQRARAHSRPPPDARTRIDRIKRLRAALLARRTEIQRAVYADFRKPPEEVDLTEIAPVLAEIRTALKSLRRWMRPRQVGNTLLYFGTRAAVHYAPKGVVLILSPWNFPLNLTFGPLVSALAAGCRVVLKPSEHTLHTSRLMKGIIDELYDADDVVLFNGQVGLAQALLELPFDHVFFTGSPAVGREVMRAASAHLSTVTLELGGKTPAVVDASADVRAAARKIAWGKYTNAGQTCIAPDYTFVHADLYDRFVAALRAEVSSLYASKDATEHAGLAHIIDDRRLERLQGMIADAEQSGTPVVTCIEEPGGPRYLPPTLILEPPPGSLVMQEEIFGPLLPLFSYRDLDEVITAVHRHPDPLTLYLFTNEEATVQRLLTETRSGSICVNDTLIHFSHAGLPFGGVGNSGMGRSHGLAGFLAFSNARSVIRQRFNHPPLQRVYPPYTPRKRRLIDWLLAYLR